MTLYYKVVNIHHKPLNWSKAADKHLVIFSRDPERFTKDSESMFTTWSWAYEDPNFDREPVFGCASRIDRWPQIKKEEMPKILYDEFLKMLEEKAKSLNGEEIKEYWNDLQN